MSTKTKPRPAQATRKAKPAQATAGSRSARIQRIHLPDGTRSVQSPWVWRGFLFMSFVAFGLFLTFAVGGRMFYAVSWGLITAAWFTISMWLWRRHVKDDNEWRARQRTGRG